MGHFNKNHRLKSPTFSFLFISYNNSVSHVFHVISIYKLININTTYISTLTSLCVFLLLKVRRKPMDKFFLPNNRYREERDYEADFEADLVLAVAPLLSQDNFEIDLILKRGIVFVKLALVERTEESDVRDLGLERRAPCCCVVLDLGLIIYLIFIHI